MPRIRNIRLRIQDKERELARCDDAERREEIQDEIYMLEEVAIDLEAE